MFALKLIIRNAFRHRLRAILTVVGVAIAILAFGLLRTLVGLWYLGVERSLCRAWSVPVRAQRG